MNLLWNQGEYLLTRCWLQQERSEIIFHLHSSLHLYNSAQNRKAIKNSSSTRFVLQPYGQMGNILIPDKYET